MKQNLQTINTGKSWVFNSPVIDSVSIDILISKSLIALRLSVAIQEKLSSPIIHCAIIN